MKIIFLKKKGILLGKQNVTEWTLLEYKKLFSIKLFYFHKTQGSQDRFHTHAFNAYSILIKGNYIEEVLKNNKIIPLKRNRKRILFIPKNNYHRITKSNGCWTLLFTGPWGNTFKELRELGNNKYLEVLCGEHRKDLNQGKIIELK